MESAHMRTGETQQLDFGGLVVLIGVNTDMVRGVLFPDDEPVVSFRERSRVVSSYHSVASPSFTWRVVIVELTFGWAVG